MTDSDLPIRGEFRKDTTTFAVRVVDYNLDDIRSYDDCRVSYGDSESPLGAQTDDPGAAGDSRSPIVEVDMDGRTLMAGPGDWIATDTSGGHYPIRHEEFERTYTPVQFSDPFELHCSVRDVAESLDELADNDLVDPRVRMSIREEVGRLRHTLDIFRSIRDFYE